MPARWSYAQGIPEDDAEAYRCVKSAPGRGWLFAPDVPCSLVFTQPDETGMSEVIFAGPFQELELSDEFRLQPTAVGHFGLRQALTPSTALRFGQVANGHSLVSNPPNRLDN
jgi:hypothetical protein